MKKKKLIIAGGVTVLVLALICVMVWPLVEKAQSRKHIMDSISEGLEAYRSGEETRLRFLINKDFYYDEKLQSFILSQAEEMYQNKEVELLEEFLSALEIADYKNREVALGFSQCVNKSKDVQYALETVTALQFLQYYNKELSFAKDSGIIASYIAENGKKTFTKTPGEGFYADGVDESQKDMVGPEDSPLYDAVAVTHMGDFKKVHSFGVQLDQYYQESHYSNTEYYFRGNRLTFLPIYENCVWSGDYLFNFDSSGELNGFTKLEK